MSIREDGSIREYYRRKFREKKERELNQPKVKSEESQDEEDEDVGYETVKSYDEIVKAQGKYCGNAPVKKYVPATKDARDFVSREFEVEYKGNFKDLASANFLNQELCRFRAIIGTIGLVDSIVVSTELPDNKLGRYISKTRTLVFHADWSFPMLAMRTRQSNHKYSTKSPFHAFRHEIGHAIYHFFRKSDVEAVARIEEVYNDSRGDMLLGVSGLSPQAAESPAEMVAEAFAQIVETPNCELALKILKALVGDRYAMQSSGIGQVV